jgi:hypothetical protein
MATLAIIVRGFAKGGPLLPIVTEDGQNYPLAPANSLEFATSRCSGHWVHIKWVCLIRLRVALFSRIHRVDRQQDRPRVREAQEHRLVAWHVPARFNQFDTWQQFGITIYQ